MQKSVGIFGKMFSRSSGRDETLGTYKMSDEGTGTDDWRVRNIEEQAPRLDLSIAHLEANIDDSQEGRDLWMISCLIKAARLAYTHLRSGWLTDSSHVAWACRNLLEIRIFSKYVSLSPENRKRFINDMTVDAVQTNDAMIRMMELVRPGCPESQGEIAKLVLTSEALQQESGYNGTSFLSPTKLAKEMGLDLELSVHKFCSKLIHPTAQSILLVDAQNELERRAMFIFGGKYLFDLMDDLVPLSERLLEQKNRP
jgi:hypothetical protein